MVKIRLRRMGTRNRPFYRIVVSDSRKVPTSSAIEEVGHYDPTKGVDSCQLDADRIRHWVENGAQMSPAVRKLFRQQEKTVA
jgi:small subunit ribosomal protein S16